MPKTNSGSELGIDSVDISRFDEDFLSNRTLLERIFTKEEIHYCSRKAKPAQHFAARFAGKEAIIKALTYYKVKIPANEIAILNNKDGSPFVRIMNDNYRDFKIKISLSHSTEIAIAVAIVSKHY